MRRVPLKQKTPMSRGTAQMKRTPMKRSGRRKHKIEGHHEPKMLAAVKGEPCYLVVPGVCHSYPEDPTVVPCHGNWDDLGKGGGLKAQDRFTVPGCAHCHQWLDFGTIATREQKRAAFFDALARWEPVRARKLTKGKKS